MEKLRQFVKKRPGLALVVAFYLLGILGLFVVQLGEFVVNRVLYVTGTLAPAELTLEDFDLLDLEADGDVLLVLSADPQMLLKDTSRRVENLVVDFAYRHQPRQSSVYWAALGQDYSRTKIAYSQNAQHQVYYLPVTGRQSLRFDPDSLNGNHITVGRIAINQPRPLWAFFVPGMARIVLVVVVPGLAASALSILFQALGPRRKGKAGTGL
ncbi:hypothetical protein LJC04_00275 [Ruminococcaceae bacterium OttesenSCG-928-O06]|nr:hypothetical protein [Ruminococcaceae bacterium OttesenSCG-928-O06]